MQILRDYQERGVNEIRDRIRSGYRRVLRVLPTGGGKTSEAAYIIDSARARGSKIVFLAHRRELIDQASARLDGLGVDHGIIMADHPRSKPWLPVQVGSIQTVHKRGLPWEPDLVFVDECFPAGTLVSGVPIEQLKLGDLVDSFNHETGRVERRPVTRLFKSEAKSLCTVKTNCGKRIVCTQNHPFFTINGYVPAVQLKHGDLLLTHVAKNMLNLQYDVHAEVMDRQDGSLLQPAMQVSGEGGTAQGGGDAVQDMREVARGKRRSIRPDQNQWNPLLARMRESFPAVVVGQERGVAERIQQRACIETHDGEQSYGAARGPGEGKCNASEDRMETEGPMREWKPNEASANAFKSTWMGNGSSGNNSWREMEVPQGRHREPGAEGSGGSGRREPLRAEGSSGGQRENGRAGITWVESVEIHEQTSISGPGSLRSDGFVYNIEVDRNHNYFADGVLVHNCHRIRGSSYQQVIQDCGKAVVIGITATPCRTDGKGLSPPFETMVIGPSLADLTAQGYLVPARTYARKKPDLRGVHTTAGDYQQDELQEAMNKPEIVGDVVKEWQKNAAGRLTVVFAVGVKHSLALRDAFRAVGVAAEHLDGETPKAERESLLRRLELGSITVLTNCGVLSEGWDCPPVSCVCIVRPTMSLVLYLQMAGRTLRTSPGKVDSIINDHGGCVYRHGLITAPREWTLDGEESRPKGKRTKDVADMVKVCPDCDRVAELTDERCPCGYVFKARRKALKTVDGELELVTEAKPVTEEEKRRRYEWFLTQQYTGKTKSGAPYSAAYAVVKFRALYGHPPKRGWREAWSQQHA